MSRLKNKKLSTGVTKLSLYGVNLSPHIKKKKNKINNEKRKRKKFFPDSESRGKKPTPETTRKIPTFCSGVVKEEKSEKAGVGSQFVENLLCKKGKGQKMAIFMSLKDFIKPSYEAIEKEKRKKDEETTKKLFEILETDGAAVAKSMIDFLSSAFVGIAGGAQNYEYHRIFENLEIYVNVKKRGEQ